LELTKLLIRWNPLLDAELVMKSNIVSGETGAASSKFSRHAMRSPFTENLFVPRRR
jgi:hypothetical protein